MLTSVRICTTSEQRYHHILVGATSKQRYKRAAADSEGLKVVPLAMNPFVCYKVLQSLSSQLCFVRVHTNPPHLSASRLGRLLNVFRTRNVIWQQQRLPRHLLGRRRCCTERYRQLPRGCYPALNEHNICPCSGGWRGQTNWER